MQSHFTRKMSLLAAAIAALAAHQALAATTTWTGSASSSWNNAANWDTSQIPDDIAAFTGPGGVVSLDAPQTIDHLTISTINALTVGTAADNTAGSRLSLTKVTREDVDGTESIQTIAAGVTLTGASVWDISGSNYLAVTGGVSGAFTLTKQGAGELRIGTSSYTGATTVSAGTLRTSGSIASSSFLTIGGAGSPATVFMGGDQQVPVRMSILAGGTFNQNDKVLYPVNITIAGQWNAGQIYPANNQSFTLRDGGLVTGGYGLSTWAYAGSINSAADSTATSTWATSIRLGTSYAAAFNIHDGAGHIDLVISGGISGASTTYAFDKNGAGVLQLTAANTFNRPLNVKAGTLLADNTGSAASATGANVVTVSAGATLGGAGYIGGGYSNARVVLGNGSVSSRATLSPGSINNSDGSLLIGTLTLGTAAQSSSISFGNYSQLLAQLGNAGSSDRLTLFGDITLNGANDALTLLSLPGATLNGEYTLVSFTGTLAGRFDSVTLDGGALGDYQLQYRDSLGQAVAGTGDISGGGSVVLVIPEPTSLLLTLGGGAFAMLARRRRQA